MQPLWKTKWKLLKKQNIGLSYDPAILLLGIYMKKMKTLIWKDLCTPTFIAALFTIAKVGKQTHTHTHTLEYYSATKRNENLPTTSIDLEYIMRSEVSQMRKINKYIMTYIWNLKTVKQTNEYNRNWLTDDDNKLISYQWGEGWRDG